MIKSMMVGLFALGAVCIASHADACAMFFEDHFFVGRSHYVNAEIGVPWLGEWNDIISSIQVEQLCKVTVYEDVNFGGASWTASGAVDWVGDFWNDRISSYICTCR
ncbi:peptidase inhibitor family I36 protein [Polyangium jinanense]|uniref:Beta/gamma crystallin 'Greek key' domain-containing protein n=1 Tax=Polyangium jinanense TaxID=2829994 RepID=A0A9X3XGQ3_9BACT|nr:peptidase inhibitor family I36 protein [Polyangium jinanense]MDC3962932.1 hypothetical protein [Polyangium jinanense]MDC3989065.1 hypothetical protein [Polyangium jinanense]